MHTMDYGQHIMDNGDIIEGDAKVVAFQTTRKCE